MGSEMLMRDRRSVYEAAHALVSKRFSGMWPAGPVYEPAGSYTSRPARIRAGRRTSPAGRLVCGLLTTDGCQFHVCGIFDYNRDRWMW